jgi:hypothetical protein
MLRVSTDLGPENHFRYPNGAWYYVLVAIGTAGRCGREGGGESLMEAGRAARKLLADHHELAATHWLVMHGRPGLTMEHAIGLPRWTELFTEADRAEAAQRLTHAGSTPRR